MGRRETIGALCVALWCSSSAAAAPPSSIPGTSTSSAACSSREAKLREAAVLYRGTLDIREVELAAAKTRVEDQKELAGAYRKLAEERPVRVEVQLPGWVWVVIAGVAIGGFTGGLVLGLEAR